ncbi:hypothetical protein [Streptomyces sp. CBMA152]|uniref:hypothetical protein n=1 Tax=Streptomyces sp. CBMA152 TaxID=1896312 RepID=UPI00166103E1|nr:hypothetical protein [Streptomyces sp. CBMA152]MBD0743609.1 hypothetical protein [Streptomyces sp. CBMA152]
MARTVPVIAQEAPGNFLTGALWNANVKALGDYETLRPLFFGYQGSAQSISNNTWTSLTLDTEVLDGDGGHSTVTNTNRYTVQVAGTYLLLGVSAFVANTTSVRGVRMGLNGTVIRGSHIQQQTSSAGVWSGTSWAIQTCAVNDWVDVAGYQNSGGAINTFVGTDASSCMGVYWISR